MCGAGIGAVPGVIRGRHGRPKTEENKFGKPAKHRCEKFRYTGSFRLITDKLASTDSLIFAVLFAEQILKFAGVCESQNDCRKIPLFLAFKERTRKPS